MIRSRAGTGTDFFGGTAEREGNLGLREQRAGENLAEGRRRDR